MCKTQSNPVIARGSNSHPLVHEKIGYAQALCAFLEKTVIHSLVMHICTGLVHSEEARIAPSFILYSFLFILYSLL